jgi:DHA1 family bicyclomycin/chloramphenicol resistance-like MFS transporter
VERQAILTFSSWRSIFGFFLIVGLVSLLWLYSRQPETLAKEKRLKFSVSVIFAGIKETLKHPISRTYTLAAGIIFGSFVGYLSSAQQILQVQYKLGESFSLYFGGLALAIGLSSFVNSRLVMKFSMEILCIASLSVLSVISFLFFFYAQSVSGHPNLIILMTYFAIIFFCFGILFGNFNTLAVQPLGHIAGVANSVISSIQTLISVIIGGTIGQYYNGTVQPLIIGFLVCAVTTLTILSIHSRKNVEITTI